ncbi:hypothetical protein MSAN_00925400 [Mycena sanguinolenta]|uniref:Uncharacterized protein n=1 Tax=Mycena sanguinolenta TaxID=230812 RepID=A0A8H6YT39_9AGAR|nr:hypothetical protein MSAN_00925400 [Mycena sanguinolenta]
MMYPVNCSEVARIKDEISLLQPFQTSYEKQIERLESMLDGKLPMGYNVPAASVGYREPLYATMLQLSPQSGCLVQSPSDSPAVALGTGQLWTTIQLPTSIAQLNFYILHSKSAPLAVTFGPGTQS